MGEYIKLFNTHNEYEAYINSQNKILPNVSYCELENEVYYNPWVETRLVAKFNITDTNNTINIIDSNATSQFSEMEIDGVKQETVINEYTFSTIGIHTIKFVLKNNTKINNRTFELITNLVSIVIPDTVTSIGDYIFSECSNLTSVTLSKNLTYIGEGAFSLCRSLSSIIIPPSVKYIWSFTFENCTNLSSVIIPDGLLTISHYSFSYCSGLTSIEIPSSVTFIGTDAFSSCTNLESVIVKALNPPEIYDEYVFDNNADNRKIYVPSESLEAYRSANGWSELDIESI